LHWWRAVLYRQQNRYQETAMERGDSRSLMEQLWAPWRLGYIAAAKQPAHADPCFVCCGLAEDDDRKNLIIERTPHSVVLLNRFPYNNGHLLVAPRNHQATLGALD